MKNMGAFFFSSLIFLSLSPLAKAQNKIQSSFKGPVSLKVWEHWQQSWNVEEVSTSYLFELQRGTQENGNAYTTLKLKSVMNDLEARIQCESYVPRDMWSMQVQQSETLSQKAQSYDAGNAYFHFDKAPCTDEVSKRIVRRISFKVFNNIGEEVFNFSLVPMYVRSKDQNYWNNPIPAYSAHAGTGDVMVSNWISDGNDPQSDTWGDVRVKPVLNFVDLNFMKKDAKIGLHRHERNQEAYLIVEGKATMLMGLAPKVPGSEERVSRPWSLAQGDVRDVNQFSAYGGWIESRILNANELSVIVPRPDNNDTVYFHGINAEEDTRFFTMGTKN